MFAAILATSLAIAWVIAEVLQTKVIIRLILGASAMLTIAIVAVAFQVVFTGFQATLHANNATKNLARGLVEITGGNFDQAELHQNLKLLDDYINPTYHDHNSAQEAVIIFLRKYQLNYVKELPLDDSSNQKQNRD